LVWTSTSSMGVGRCSWRLRKAHTLWHGRRPEATCSGSVGRNLTTARFNATVQVHDADENVVDPHPPPPKAWHESLRYYRVSESSTDLHDSFRNLYLALEALLSSVAPRS
jgi:hypothetical protein